jgi:hypothetical protein
MIPALHAGGHGFESHSLHTSHGSIHILYKLTELLLNKTLLNGTLKAKTPINTTTITTAAKNGRIEDLEMKIDSLLRYSAVL